MKVVKVADLNKLNQIGILDRVAVGNNFDPTKLDVLTLIEDLRQNVIRFVYRKQNNTGKELSRDLLVNDLMRIAYGTRNPDLIKRYVSDDKADAVIDGYSSEDAIAKEVSGNYIKYFDLEARAFRTFRLKAKNDDAIDNRLMACEVSPTGKFKGLSWVKFSIDNPAWYEIVNYVGKDEEETIKYQDEINTVLRKNKANKELQNKIYNKYYNGEVAKVSTNTFAQKLREEEFNGGIKGDLAEHFKVTRDSLDEAKNAKKVLNDERKRKESIALTKQKFNEAYQEFMKPLREGKVLSNEYQAYADILFKNVNKLGKIEGLNFKPLGYKNGLYSFNLNNELIVVSPLVVANITKGGKPIYTKIKTLKLGRPRHSDLDDIGGIKEFLEGLGNYAKSFKGEVFVESKVSLSEDDVKRLANIAGYIEMLSESNKYKGIIKLLGVKDGLDFYVSGRNYHLDGNTLSVYNSNSVLVPLSKKQSGLSYSDWAEAINKNVPLKQVIGSEAKVTNNLIANVIKNGSNLRKKALNYEVYASKLSQK